MSELEIIWNEAGTKCRDDNNNVATLSRWGTREAAEDSLRSLKNCSDCWDCLDCWDCRNCLDCWGCRGCRGCLDCWGCRGCLDCRAESLPKPKIKDIDKEVYAAVTSSPDALDMSSWHSHCGTTHCRAGWVVTLAGEAGKALEEHLGTGLAAQIIYRESGSPINPVRFFDSNEDAMADMKARAEA